MGKISSMTAACAAAGLALREVKLQEVELPEVASRGQKLPEAASQETALHEVKLCSEKSRENAPGETSARRRRPVRSPLRLTHPAQSLAPCVRPTDRIGMSGQIRYLRRDYPAPRPQSIHPEYFFYRKCQRDPPSTTSRLSLTQWSKLDVILIRG